jgi:hypothetical protein
MAMSESPIDDDLNNRDEQALAWLQPDCACQWSGVASCEASRGIAWNECAFQNPAWFQHVPLCNDPNLLLHTTVLAHDDACALPISTDASFNATHPPEACASAFQAQCVPIGSSEVQSFVNMQPSKKRCLGPAEKKMCKVKKEDTQKIRKTRLLTPAATTFLKRWAQEHPGELYPTQWVKDELASASVQPLALILTPFFLTRLHK